MARGFVAGSLQYLEYAGAVVSSVPLTMACWGNRSSSSANACLMAITRDTGVVRDGYVLDVLESGATDTLRALYSQGGSSASSPSSTGVPSSGWFHAAGVFVATNSRTSYLNGVASPVNSTNLTAPSGLNRTAIGRIPNFNGSAIEYWDGSIAEAGIWNVALDAGEITALAAGVSPLLVRPASLVAYWPLMGLYSPEIDPRGQQDMAVTGATRADHCRVRLKSSANRTLFVPGAAGLALGEDEGLTYGTVTLW